MEALDLHTSMQKVMKKKYEAENRTSFQLILNSVENCPKKKPTFSSFSIRDFKNAINFNPEELSENSDFPPEKIVVRNESIKDSPFLFPNCCNRASNMCRDRRSARKLKQYNLIKRMRKPSHFLENEKPEICETVISEEEYEKIPVKIVDEGYVVPDSDSEEDSTSIYAVKKDAESIEEVCSGCSTLEGTFTRNVKPKEKMEIRTFTEIPKYKDPCVGAVHDLKAEQRNIRYPKCCF